MNCKSINDGMENKKKIDFKQRREKPNKQRIKRGKQ